MFILEVKSMKVYKISTVFLMLVILFMCISFAVASDNATDSLSDSSKTFENIQKNVNENTTVNLDGYYSGDKEITISKSLTVQGVAGGAVLDGKNNTRAFNVQSGQVTFKNLKFTNCIANDGGAIFSKASITLINCTFINNYAVNGAAVYSLGNLTIADSSFTKNSAGKYGGVVYSFLSITKKQSTSRYGNIIIKNTKFNENSAESGGAVTAYFTSVSANSKFGNINIENCEFTGNNVTDMGGAIFISGEKNFGKLTLTKSLFNSNAAREGSALLISSMDGFNAENCNFNNNKAEKGTACFDFSVGSVIKNCNFTGNYADTISCVMAFLSTVTIENSRFSSNSLGVISSYSDSKITVINGKTKNNYGSIKVLDNSLKTVTPVTAAVDDFVTTYDSHEKFYTTLKNTYNNLPAQYFNFRFKFVSSKKTKTYYVTTNEDGKTHFKFTSSLPAGKYKVTFVSEDWSNIKGSAYITVKKAKTTVKAPKVTNKFKKSQYFKITVKYKKTKQSIKYNTKVKIKVYIGKKAKTYTVKIKDNGVCKFNTKKLTKGKHKVVIKDGSGNYKISAKSVIKIK